MMTNATTVENNSTTHDQISKETCNQTASSDNEKHNCVLNTLQIQNNHCSNNTNDNATNCETITTPANSTEQNQVADKNTVLKYVYKKGDKAEIPLKDKGHFKNSLRRKRSADGIHDKSPLASKFQKPVIVNYETVHGSGEVLAPLRNSGNNILGANLADFNIETLHLNPDIKKDEKIDPHLKKDSSEAENLNEASSERGDKQNDSNANSNSESEESGERGDYKNEKPKHENENSDERGDYRNRKPSRDDEDSAERSDYKTSKSTSDKDASGEREDYRNKKSSREIDDSSEHVDNKNRPSYVKEDDSDERGAYKNSNSGNERGESGERNVYKNDESNRGRDDSSERGDYKTKRNGSGETYNSAESTENSPETNSRYSSRNQNSKDNSGSSESSKPVPNNSESKESTETNNRDKKAYDEVPEKRKNAGYHEENRSYEAPLLRDSKHKKIETYPEKNLDSSNESSDEGYLGIEKIRKPQQNHNTDIKNESHKNSPAPLRDIDLRDFNYERVHLNSDGKVEPQKDNLEYVNPKTAVEILPLTTAVPSPEIKNHQTLNYLPDVNTLASPKVDNNNNKLIHIDDGEVRPVVEINPEIDNDEEKSSASDEAESLESLLGVKEPENFEDSSQNDKIVEEKDVQNDNVKQEFERIPVNYNHAKKTENKDNPNTETPKKDTEVPQRDGTLDVFAPEDIKYDEHLNIKFDDLTIKLPEIKLPDDILAYTRESSPYSYGDDKKQSQPDVPSYKPSYYYDRDDKEQIRERKVKKEDDDSDDVDDEDNAPDSGYYGYYGDSDKKQNYKKKNTEAESDEEEDLYEKFVRERFGKRGTFEKRSEKLQAAAPKNPELYKTIKHILKKTADIDEQAKKSGDPNAGYMWTLEYGENM